jgi:hypothetical protein
MTVKRMDNVLIVVDDLDAVKAFFIALGLTLEGETTVEGPEVGRLSFSHNLYYVKSRSWMCLCRCFPGGVNNRSKPPRHASG